MKICQLHSMMKLFLYYSHPGRLDKQTEHRSGSKFVAELTHGIEAQSVIVWPRRFVLGGRLPEVVVGPDRTPESAPVGRGRCIGAVRLL